QTLETALAGFTADSFNDTEAAIAAVGASGDPRAGDVIEALQSSRLLFSAENKKGYIKGKADKVRRAATGAEVSGPPADLSPVRVNNRVRRAIDAVLGGLALFAADPGKRLEAAQAVFKSRNPSALPALDAAIAKETNSAVKTALIEARAAIVLNLA